MQSKDKEGRFVRQTSSFRKGSRQTGSPARLAKAALRPKRGHYHLYVALICLWASRALIARSLKGLKDLIPVTMVEPFLTDQGWRFGNFPGASEDPLSRATYMHEIYTRADDLFTGGATVPVLWDTKRARMVNNESVDILRMFSTQATLPMKSRLLAL